MNICTRSLLLGLLCSSFLVSCTEIFDLESTFHSIFAGSAAEPSARAFLAELGAAVEESSSSGSDTEAPVEVYNARGSEPSTQMPPYHLPNFEAFPRMSRVEQLMLRDLRVVEVELDWTDDVEAPFHAPTLPVDNPALNADRLALQPHNEHLIMLDYAQKMSMLQCTCGFIFLITGMAVGRDYGDDLLRVYLWVAIGIFVGGSIGYAIL